jgi:hypothetical protein
MITKGSQRVAALQGKSKKEKVKSSVSSSLFTFAFLLLPFQPNLPVM